MANQKPDLIECIIMQRKLIQAYFITMAVRNLLKNLTKPPHILFRNPKPDSKIRNQMNQMCIIASHGSIPHEIGARTLEIGNQTMKFNDVCSFSMFLGVLNAVVKCASNDSGFIKKYSSIFKKISRKTTPQ